MLRRCWKPDRFLACRVLFVLALATILGVSALAAEESPADETQESPDGPHRTYHLNGTVITWDLESKSFKAPTAEQMARIGEELGQMVAEGRGIFAGSDEPIKIDEVGGGLRRARLPLSLMSAAVAYLDEDGRLVGGACTDAATADVSREPSSNVPEVK